MRTFARNARQTNTRTSRSCKHGTLTGQAYVLLGAGCLGNSGSVPGKLGGRLVFGGVFRAFAGFLALQRLAGGGSCGFRAVDGCLWCWVCVEFFCGVLYALEGRLCVRVCALKNGGSQRKVRVPTTCLDYFSFKIKKKNIYN